MQSGAWLAQAVPALQLLRGGLHLAHLLHVRSEWLHTCTRKWMLLCVSSCYFSTTKEIFLFAINLYTTWFLWELLNIPKQDWAKVKHFKLLCIWKTVAHSYFNCWTGAKELHGTGKISCISFWLSSLALLSPPPLPPCCFWRSGTSQGMGHNVAWETSPKGNWAKMFGRISFHPFLLICPLSILCILKGCSVVNLQ